jgi:hypothetical protein
MADWDYRRPWYHGSQRRFTTLRAGSSITQDRAVARAFWLRPSRVSLPGNGTVKHDGTAPGYLYVVAEEVRSADVYPHPHPVNAARWEWLTTRELRVELIEQTQVRAVERLTDDEIAELRRKQAAAGALSFVEWSEDAG